MSRALLTTILATAVSSRVADSGPPALRETLPNGALLVRYPDLPAIDDTVGDVTEAVVDLQFGSLAGDDPNLIFEDIRGIQAASDGTIYVLDHQTSDVRVTTTSPTTFPAGSSTRSTSAKAVVGHTHTRTRSASGSTSAFNSRHPG